MAAVTGVTVFLILQESPPLNARVDPDATQRVATKMQELAYASDLRRPVLVELDEAELNAWLRSGLLHTDRVGAEQQESLRDIKIQLLDDHLRVHMVFAVVGTNLSLVLEGRVALADNHLRFLPTSGKLGSLPLPQAVLKNAARRVFEAPEQREQFLLPEDIARIEVRGGELVISSFR